MPEFFKNMWTRRTAGNRYTAKILVETTNEIAQRVGAQEVIRRLVPCMKDENEWFRYMVLNSIRDVIGLLGTSDLDTRLEEQLIDGLLYAFQEQAGEDASAVVNCFGTVLKMLGVRAKPYMSEITDKIKWRLGGRNANVRMQAADLIARIAPSLKQCGEDNALKNMGKVLYEYLGEEYPDVLGSILGALKSIVNVMGMEEMEPPIRDLLPRLTPILRNRHEKVQENCIDLVGRIADRGPEFVPAKEWSRICFDLLDMLNAKKKSIRRTTVNTFGYIAKALGPQDVMYTLLNNLKVQERQNRLCTSIAIAIVAEACAPFTVLPSLMNEYRLPEMNVQNGVLKAMSFMFEYIGETASNYIYACIPVLEDALMDRDLIHRQQASAAISHLAVGVYGEGCEDGIQHLLNYVFPNIFEVSPHLNKAVLAAIESCRLALGPPVVLMYVLQGLFHPARRVREVYWKIYNNLYIYGADALTMAYPRLEDDGVNTYRREYIEMFIWGVCWTNRGNQQGLLLDGAALLQSAHATVLHTQYEVDDENDEDHNHGARDGDDKRPVHVAMQHHAVDARFVLGAHLPGDDRVEARHESLEVAFDELAEERVDRAAREHRHLRPLLLVGEVRVQVLHICHAQVRVLDQHRRQVVLLRLPRLLAHAHDRERPVHKLQTLLGVRGVALLPALAPVHAALVVHTRHGASARGAERTATVQHVVLEGLLVAPPLGARVEREVEEAHVGHVEGVRGVAGVEDEVVRVEGLEVGERHHDDLVRIVGGEEVLVEGGEQRAAGALHAEELQRVGERGVGTDHVKHVHHLRAVEGVDQSGGERARGPVRVDVAVERVLRRVAWLGGLLDGGGFALFELELRRVVDFDGESKLNRG